MTDIGNLRELRAKAPDGWWTAEGSAQGYNHLCAHDSNWALPWVAGSGTWVAFEYIAALHNAFPALASELEAARKVVAAAEWFHEQQGRGTEEGCLFCEDIPEIGTKPCWLEDSLRAYLRVMEEQR